MEKNDMIGMIFWFRTNTSPIADDNTRHPLSPSSLFLLYTIIMAFKISSTICHFSIPHS